MDENTSLINIGELSKPATVLVEKISDAVGGIFKPYQIVRVAKAEALADRVRDESQIEISDIQRRAFHRFLQEEGTKQKNIEDITQKALPRLTEDSKPNEVEDDWITHFFDRCRLISDDEMQNLWSKILAGEANSPGKFSKRTVNFLSGLDKNEAELFAKFCGFVWRIQGSYIPLVYDVHKLENHAIYTNDMVFGGFNHFQSIGLIHYETVRFGNTSPAEMSAEYFGRNVKLKLFPPDALFENGSALLTKIGKELAPICQSESVPGFFEFVIHQWKSMGYGIVPVDSE